MKKITIIILMMMLSIAVGEGVSVYKIWSPYDSPNSPIMHVDLSEQVLYIGIVNKDSYEHDVVVEANCDGKTWRTGVISLPPNSHIEKIVEVRVPISDDKEHDVKISLIEDGKTIASTTVKVRQYFPIDVRNITCETSYKTGDSEVCYSNWFDITLKSNPTAKSDYIANVWIVAKDGNNILYDGKNDNKTVYIPLGGEVKIPFKIPKIVLDKDRFTIETHVEVMNVSHSIEGIEETTQKRDNNGEIYYEYKSSPKYYYLPVIIKNVELYNKIDENTSKMIRNFYRSAQIEDEDIETALSDPYFQKTTSFPRYYVKDDPILAVLKITLENKYNRDVNADLTVKYKNTTIRRVVGIDKEDEKVIYLPIYVKKGSYSINVSVYPSDLTTLEFNKIYTVNVDPQPISPIIVEKIILPKDKNIESLNKLGGSVIIGKTYNMTICLKNIYNKTLLGEVILSDKFGKGVVNYTQKVSFTASPHKIVNITIPITFHKEVNGDIKIEVKANDAVKDYITSAHFYAVSPISIVRVYYNNTLLLGRVNIINGSGGVYTNKPVAGFNNTCIVILRNDLNSNITCKVWVEVIDKQGKVRAKSCVKTIKLQKDSEGELSFPIFFNEGFEGYTIVHVIPSSYDRHIDLLYTEGYGIHPVEIPQYYEVGRYSAVDILGNEVPTGTHVVTEVIAPILITHLKYDKDKNAILATLENEKFPVNLTVYYWIIAKNWSSSIYSVNLYPKSSKEVLIPMNLSSGEYNITFYAKVDNFALYNNTLIPVILKKSIVVNISSKNINKNNENNTKIGTTEGNVDLKSAELESNINEKQIKMEEKNNTTTEKSNKESKKEGSIFDTLGDFFKGIISIITGFF